MMNGADPYSLTVDSMHTGIRDIQFNVLPLVRRSEQIQKELENETSNKSFKSITRMSSGDSQAAGQKPNTFLRQVLSLCLSSDLLTDNRFPSDVKARAHRLLASCRGGSLGAYTSSAGLEVVRQDIAKYIETRDGHPANPKEIFLCGGATEGIRNILKFFNVWQGGKQPGVLVPVPQYPLYIWTTTEYNMKPIEYFLDESKHWTITVEELQRATSEARNKGIKPRVLVIINPGNPTGQLLSRQSLEEVIKFAYREKLFILADEVYQDNIHAPGCKFVSVRKVLTELGSPYCNVELASFMSASKGFTGECGLRGGYVELRNVDPDIMLEFLKATAVKLCPTTVGQVAMDVVVNPPQPGEPSYKQFHAERQAVLVSLTERAKMVEEILNTIPGITCNPIQGALYAFPRIDMPSKAITAAQSMNQEPDVYYSSQLLEETGILVVPGSGCGQQPGTYHFRMTILLEKEKLRHALQKIRDFHEGFIRRHL